MIKRGYALYYYKPDSENETEFLIEKDKGVVPIEVKAGRSATPSLDQFMESYSPRKVYKHIGGKNGTTETKHTIPHCMVIFL